MFFFSINVNSNYKLVLSCVLDFHEARKLELQHEACIGLIFMASLMVYFVFVQFPCIMKFCFSFCYVNCMRIINVNLCSLLHHGEICMRHFLIWFVELEKFTKDFILISLCFLIFLFLFTFIYFVWRRKRLEKICSIFLIFLFSCITFFVCFC